LFKSIAGKNAKNNGHTGIQLRQLHAARDLAGDVVKVRGFTAQDASDGDHRVSVCARG